MVDQVQAQVRCPACGEAFGCGADSGACWCEALPKLPMPEGGQAECLCPKCLSERVEAAPTP